jgi:hypothetical protein
MANQRGRGERARARSGPPHCFSTVRPPSRAL